MNVSIVCEGGVPSSSMGFDSLVALRVLGSRIVEGIRGMDRTLKLYGKLKVLAVARCVFPAVRLRDRSRGLITGRSS